MHGSFGFGEDLKNSLGAIARALRMSAAAIILRMRSSAVLCRFRAATRNLVAVRPARCTVPADRGFREQRIQGVEMTARSAPASASAPSSICRESGEASM